VREQEREPGSCHLCCFPQRRKPWLAQAPFPLAIARRGRRRKRRHRYGSSLHCSEVPPFFRQVKKIRMSWYDRCFFFLRSDAEKIPLFSPGAMSLPCGQKRREKSFRRFPFFLPPGSGGETREEAVRATPPPPDDWLFFGGKGRRERRGLFFLFLSEVSESE